jgi:putative flippase GtrA
VFEFFSLTTIKEIIRFNIVGIINTFLAYIVYSVFVLLGFTYSVALIADYCFSVSFSLFANKTFTFGYHEKIKFLVVVKMIGSYIFMYFVNLLFLWVCVTLNGMDAFLSQALSVVLIAAFSYGLQKFFVFRTVRNEK